MKKSILFVGEHPQSYTGNGNMMAAILSQVDMDKFDVTCFVANQADPTQVDVKSPYPYYLIPAMDGPDEWGANKLLHILNAHTFHFVVFVGIDVWRYARIYPNLEMFKKAKGFRLIGLFPYDLQMLRKDWVSWFNIFDEPMVYSQYGYDMLKDHVPALSYFRPPLHNVSKFFPMKEEAIAAARQELFPGLRPDDVLIGFVGANQFRKDPQKLIQAFFDLRRRGNTRLRLYLHTLLIGRVYNLKQFCMDCGGSTGLVYTKDQSIQGYSAEKMNEVYNSMDLLVNCSLQEGLSWTPIEALLAGTPVVLSDSTAHKELCPGRGHGVRVPLTQEAYVPMTTEGGESWVAARACSSADIADAMEFALSNPNTLERMGKHGRIFAEDWTKGCNNINDVLLRPAQVRVASSRIPAVLFAQHSSAGDVLMSTQCFKGLKERHPNKKLVYMTQQQFAGIVEDNPYLDEIIPWDQTKLTEYEIVYNPHGEKILPGGFNNLDATLHSMYPYFCGRLQPGQMLISEIKPENLELPEEYVVVHTTGGQPQYRCYAHMDLVVRGLSLPVVQIGGLHDLLCKTAKFDLRGQLSWRQTAYVVSRAKAAVVIDSFPSHLCGALGTPAVVLYGPAPARVVRPRDDEGVIVNLEPNKLDVCPTLSNCWGNVPGKMPCQSPCINTIHPMTVRAELEKILGGK